MIIEPPRQPKFRLMSFNMFDGEADPGEVAEQAARADVVILIETTPAALRALKPYGWDKRFPYALGDPKDGFCQYRGLLALPAEPQ